MIFIPVAILAFIGFILIIPVLFTLGYFNIIVIGFEKLGISPEFILILFLAILVGSLVNIPLGRPKIFYKERTRFFGLLKRPEIQAQGVAINVGGAVVPLLISFYFLALILLKGYSLSPVLTTTLLMILFSKIFSRAVPGKGVTIHPFAPPVFAAIFALIFAYDFAAPCAFISGVFGTIIGADLLNLRKIQKFGGFISIGGAGVFDGIFLVGIISALLVGI